ATNRTLHFNQVLDATVAGFFLVLVVIMVALCALEWWLLLARTRRATLRESVPVWLPEYAAAREQPLGAVGLLTIAVALTKELSGEAELDRADQVFHSTCGCTRSAAPETMGSPTNPALLPAPPTVALRPARSADAGIRLTREQRYVRITEKRFTGVNRCC
ncbi:MAG: hypothetical protein KGS61_13235, partial [Verrucomicrobia bacterium]|nr:hypothetical protein [Verrucomicrobiota bacterium]